MAKKAVFTFKKIISVLAVFAVMLGFIAGMAYFLVFPSFDPEILINPGKAVDAPERQRIYQITDEFIGTYRGIESWSELSAVGSEEWVRTTLETLEADKKGFSRYDPLHTEGSVFKAYDDLTTWEIRILKLYIDLYDHPPEPGADSSIDGAAYNIPSGVEVKEEDFVTVDEMWDIVVASYDVFRAADAEYLAKYPKDNTEGAKDSKDAPPSAGE